VTDGVAPIHPAPALRGGIHRSDFDGDNFDNLYYNKAGSKLLEKECQAKA